MPRSHRYIPMNRYGPMQRAGGAGAASGKPELFQMANWAANAEYEADAVTGIVEGGLGSATITKETTLVSGTVYAAKIVYSGGSSAISIDLEDALVNLTLGVEYEIIVTARHLGSGGNVRIALSSIAGGTGNDGGDIIAPLTSAIYDTYSKTFTHEAATRYLSSREFSPTDDGGLYISSISIKAT